MRPVFLLFLLLPIFCFSQTNILQPTGSVGVGTTNPQDLFVVDAGSIRRGITLLSDGDNFVFSDFQFTIKNLNNVGVGKPFSWKISHRKDGYFSDNSLGESSLEFYGDLNGGKYFAPLSFKSNGDVILVSNKNSIVANVGIGTTSPKEKLSVNGNIRAHGIKVETLNWPDYVFEKEYELLSLSELKSYIEVNKKLPGIPSAREISKDGQDLGEINKQLLKKIEELTLYILEQDKKFSDRLDEISKRLPLN